MYAHILYVLKIFKVCTIRGDDQLSVHNYRYYSSLWLFIKIIHQGTFNELHGTMPDQLD